MTDSLATTISNWGFKDGDVGYNQMDTKAASAFATGWVRLHPQLASILAYQMNMIATSERDMVGSPERKALGMMGTLTQRYIGQNETLQIGNQGTDNMQRAAVIVAKMMTEGSFKAIKFNEKIGWFEYDIKKDLRFYTKDGKERTENGEHSIAKEIYNNNIKQGLQDKDNPIPVWGWDSHLMMQMKWYADRFVVASISPDVKALLGNDFLGALVTQFRLFQIDKLNNAGIFCSYSTRKSEFGGGYHAVQITNDDGTKEWISEREIIEIEGTWKSWAYVFSNFNELTHANLKDWWKMQSPMRRKNLAKSASTIAFIILAIAAINGLLDDDDDEVARRRRKNFNDLWLKFVKETNVWTNAGDLITNPIPSFTVATKLFNIAIGKDSFDKILNFAGPVKETMNAYRNISHTNAEIEAEDKQERHEEYLAKKAENK